MARLIDKDEAINALEMMEKYDDGYILADHQEILERLREIDPWNHNEWKYDEDTKSIYCGHCGIFAEAQRKTDFCPHCGSRMDGVRMKELKPCPFCGGKMEFIKTTYTNKFGKEITEQYYMHKNDNTDCILDDICMPFVIGAGDARPEDGYIGEYAEKWNRRADDGKDNRCRCVGNNL